MAMAMVAGMAACLPAGHGARAQAWGNAGGPGALSTPMSGIMHQHAATDAQAWRGTVAHMRADHDAARATWSADARADATARRDMNRPSPGRDAPDNTDMPGRAPDAATGGDAPDARDPYTRDWARFAREEAHLRDQMRHAP